MSADTSELWSYVQLCQFTRMGRRTLENLVSAGEIPYLKIGRLVRFDPAAVKTWLQRYVASK